MQYRIISDDAATPVMCSPNDFELIDGSMPSSWMAYIHDNGDFELAPSAWLEPGFWVRYFDGEEDAKRIFEQNISSLPCTQFVAGMPH